MKAAWQRVNLRGLHASSHFTKQSHFAIPLEVFPGDPGDIHVHRHGRRDAALRAASGLEALEFVKGPVEVTHFWDLVPGEFGKGIPFVRVPHKSPAERGGFRV